MVMFFVDLCLNVYCNMSWIVKSHLIFYCLLGSEPWGGSSFVHLYRLLLADPGILPGHLRDRTAAACPGAASGSPPRRTRLEHLARTTSSGSSQQEEQQLYFEDLLDVWAPHPMSEAEPSHPPEERWRLCLQPCSSNLSVKDTWQKKMFKYSYLVKTKGMTIASPFSSWSSEPVAVAKYKQTLIAKSNILKIMRTGQRRNGLGKQENMFSFSWNEHPVD